MLLLPEGGRGEVTLLDTLGYNERAELLAALRAHGIAGSDVDAVFLSHFHFDHAVNYRLFPNATIYLHERELHYARSEWERDLAVPIELLADLEGTGRLELLSGAEGTVLGLEWLLTPGHTAGLCSLLVREAGGVTALASDAVKHRGELVAGESQMAWDRAASRKSIARLLELADLVIPGHDAPVAILGPQQPPAAGDLEARGGHRLRPQRAAGVEVHLAEGVPGAKRSWRLRLED